MPVAESERMGELLVQELTGLPVIWKPLKENGNSPFKQHPYGEGYSLADWERDRADGLHSEAELAAWRAGCFVRIRMSEADALALLERDAESFVTKRVSPEAIFSVRQSGAFKVGKVGNENVIDAAFMAGPDLVKPLAAGEAAALSRSLDTHANALLTVGTGMTYATISAAIAAASSGDSIACFATTGNTYTENITSTTAALQIAGLVGVRGLTIVGTVSLAANSWLGNFKIAPTGVVAVAVTVGSPASVESTLVDCSGGTITEGIRVNGHNARCLLSIVLGGAATGITVSNSRNLVAHCTSVGNTTGFNGTVAVAGPQLLACLAANNGTDFGGNLAGTAANCAWNVSEDASALGDGSATGFLDTDLTETWKLSAAVVATTVARLAGFPLLREDAMLKIRRRSGVFFAGAHDPDPGYIPVAAEVSDTVTAYGLDNELAGTIPSTVPVFSGITSLTDNADGTLTAAWGAATGEDEFEVHVKAGGAPSAGEIAARTYLACAADADATSQRIANTATGAKLTAGTTYYVAVVALNGAGQDGNTTALARAVTNPLASTSPVPVTPCRNNQGEPPTSLLAATATTVYVCPATKRALVRLLCTNVDDAANRTVTLYRVRSGQSAGDAGTVLHVYNLLVNGAPAEEGPLELEPGDSIQGLCSSASAANLEVSGVEWQIQ